MEVGLGEKNGPRGSEPGEDGRIFIRHEIRKDLGAGGRADALRIDEVFDRQGHAVERTLHVAAPPCLVSRPRLLERGLGAQRDESVELRDRLRALELSLDELDGVQVATFELSHDGANRRKGKVSIIYIGIPSVACGGLSSEGVLEGPERLFALGGTPQGQHRFEPRFMAFFQAFSFVLREIFPELFPLDSSHFL